MKIINLILIITSFILMAFVSAEQVVWDNDSNITLQDSWKDVDGRPLFSASCTWYVYNPSGTLNQSGTHVQIVPGIFEISINQLTTIGIYPLIFNCNKSGNLGISSKDSIRIVDEITEDFKYIIEQINVTTIEINETTHMTYDLLAGEINDTLNTILDITNFTKENLTQINSQLDLILSDTNLIVEKWGDEDADEIVNKIKDLKRQISDLEFRIKFVSSEEFETRTLSIFSSSNYIKNKLNDSEDGTNFTLWFWIILCFLILVLVIIVLASSKK